MPSEQLLLKKVIYTLVPFLFVVFFLSVLSKFFFNIQHDTYLLVESKPASDLSLQVFFDDGSGFNEENSSRVDIKASGIFERILFKLPEKKIEKVRLDFAGKGQKMSIKKIVVLDGTGVQRASLRVEDVARAHDVQINAADQEGIHSVSWSSGDPFLVFPVSYSGGFSPVLSPGNSIVLSVLFSPFLVAVSRRFLAHEKKSAASGGKGGHWFRNTLLVQLLVVAFLISGFWTCYRDKLQGALLISKGGHLKQQYAHRFEREEVVLQRDDGLSIAAWIYAQPADTLPRKAFLLLHGNYPRGQMFPLYPVIAQELAQRGFVVMTIDFAGYGMSEDPFVRTQPVSVDLESETRTALNYLSGLSYVDSGQIGIIGHSMGADPALRVGLSSDLVSSITLIGPPRRVWERFHNPSDRDFFWSWAQKAGKEQYGRQAYPDWYSREQWLDDILRRDMMRMKLTLQSWQHKPVLFIDGQREPPADKSFLHTYFLDIAYPKKYVTLYKADHNCNVFAHKGQVFYTPEVMLQLVDLVAAWHTDAVTGTLEKRDYLLNVLDWLFWNEKIYILLHSFA